MARLQRITSVWDSRMVRRMTSLREVMPEIIRRGEISYAESHSCIRVTSWVTSAADGGSYLTSTHAMYITSTKHSFQTNIASKQTIRSKGQTLFRCLDSGVMSSISRSSVAPLQGLDDGSNTAHFAM